VDRAGPATAGMVVVRQLAAADGRRPGAAGAQPPRPVPAVHGSLGRAGAGDPAVPRRPDPGWADRRPPPRQPLRVAVVRDRPGRRAGRLRTWLCHLWASRPPRGPAGRDGRRLGHQLHLDPRAGSAPAGPAAVPRRPPAHPPLGAAGVADPDPGRRAAARGGGQPGVAAAVPVPRQSSRRHRWGDGLAGPGLRPGRLPAVPGHAARRRPGPGAAVSPRPWSRAPAAEVVRGRRAGPGRGPGRRHHQPLRVRLQPAN
jgi:hypothetical protein